jgi:hypothetical protein
MGIALKIVDQTSETRPTTVARDYSVYTLRQLLKERYWIDTDRLPDGCGAIEREIAKRCERFKESTRRKGSAATAAIKRYRPYGFILGVAFLLISSGPFLAVEFLDAMHLIADTHGDHALLSGVWALLTLPFAVMVVIIGGIMDAERVVKWLNL